MARRYVSIAYDDDGRVRDRRSLKEADADLRANLAELVAADQVTVEVARVLNIVATNPDAGLNPDRGSPTN